jgi:hypothetical protein
MAEASTLTFSSLTPEEQLMAQRALNGEIDFEPPYEGFTFNAATYVVMVRDHGTHAIAAGQVGIEMGLTDGCEKVSHLHLVR